MNKLGLSVAAAAMVMSTGIGVAEAHINLSWPLPRYEIAGVDQKTGPCGGGTASMDVTTFAPGEEVTVTWTETINHPGHFRIALDMTGTDDFTDPLTENDMDVVGNVIAYMPDEGGSNFQYTFNMPDTECTGCVLQVIQVMTDKLGNGFGGYPDNDDLYYWCADINITSGGATTSSASTGAGTGGAAGTGGGDPSSGAGGSSSDSSGAGQGVDQGSFDNNDGGGCSIAAPKAPGPTGAWVLAGLALGALARRRRR